MKNPDMPEIRCRCPFCDNGQGKLSASINKGKNLFYCFRCREGLNAVSLYAKVYGINTEGAYKELFENAA